MNVRKISASHLRACDLPKLFDEEKIDFVSIDTVNWSAYPYRPKAKFRIAHTGNTILLHFKVNEEAVRAKYGRDNESVWTDSCVEFFCKPTPEGAYYNLECNCIGTLLIGAGPAREGRERASAEVTGAVQRWASLGNEPFETLCEPTTWEVALIVPCSVFFKDEIVTLDGMKVKANFYKCGDELPTPHFLSWNPIDAPKPDFHRPDFFGDLEFGKDEE